MFSKIRESTELNNGGGEGAEEERRRRDDDKVKTKGAHKFGGTGIETRTG